METHQARSRASPVGLPSRMLAGRCLEPRLGVRVLATRSRCRAAWERVLGHGQGYPSHSAEHTTDSLTVAFRLQKQCSAHSLQTAFAHVAPFVRLRRTHRIPSAVVTARTGTCPCCTYLRSSHGSAILSNMGSQGCALKAGSSNGLQVAQLEAEYYEATQAANNMNLAVNPAVQRCGQQGRTCAVLHVSKCPSAAL